MSKRKKAPPLGIDVDDDAIFRCFQRALLTHRLSTNDVEDHSVEILGVVSSDSVVSKYSTISPIIPKTSIVKPKNGGISENRESNTEEVNNLPSKVRRCVTVKDSI